MIRTLPLNLYILILVSLVSFLIGMLRLSSKRKNQFPKKIKNFIFKKIIENENRGNTLAIYKDKNKQVIVKTFQGKFKSADYYTLKNEILVSGILTKVINRISKKIPASLRKVRIPKIIFVYELKNQLFVGTEFIQSVPLKKLSNKKQIQIYFKVNRFLKFIGEHLTETEKKKLSKRDASSVIKIYPLLIIKSLFTNPAEIITIFKSLQAFRRLSHLIHKLHLVLSHRDAHMENILVSKDGVYLIDLEFAVIGPELFDEVNTLRDEWSNSKIRKGFIEKLKFNYRAHKDISSIMRVVALNVGMHGLSVKDLPKNIKRNYSNFLKHALQPGAFK